MTELLHPLSDVENVILLIGDGMGDPQISLAREYLYGDEGVFPGIDALPFTGELTTYSLSKSNGKPDYTTDSAASATAWATGVKTYDAALGVDRGGQPLPTLLEAAKAAGLATGDVTTDELQGATPGAQVAHVSDRHCYGPGDSDCGADALEKGGRGSIAEQLLTTRPDVAIGGGADAFEKKAAAGEYAGKSLFDQAQARGYQVVRSADKLAAASAANQSAPLLAVLADGVLPTVWKETPARVGGSDAKPVTCEERSKPRVSLAAMTTKAIDLLKVNDKGFFLQVEGASIDKESHAADPCGQIGETADLDAAVAAALDFAKQDGHTLVILTADHGQSSQFQDGPTSGTKSLALKTEDGRVIYTEYNSAPSSSKQQQHSGSQVRVAAYGPGAANVVGLSDQTDLFATIATALNLERYLQDLDAQYGATPGQHAADDQTAALRQHLEPVDEAENVILITAPGLDDNTLTAARDYAFGAAGTLPGIDELPIAGQLQAATRNPLTDSRLKLSPDKSVTAHGVSSYQLLEATRSGFAKSARTCLKDPGVTNLGDEAAEIIQSLKSNPFFLHINTTAVADAVDNADACGQLGAALNVAAAVKAALDFAKEDRNTLLIFTGGSAGSSQIIDKDPYSANSLKLATADGANLGLLYGAKSDGRRTTGSQVSVWAYGPGAANLLGLHTPADIAALIKAATG
ncbi:MAG: alkaline phosphatase [Propionibacteriaceae bacterium]|nr:alkaline phosphatase [Propionibacteriaceae bacterium]